MSETTLTAELPDGSFQPCFSPTDAVRKYFKAGQIVPAAEFVRLSRAAMGEAAELIRREREFPANAAAASLADVERWAGALPPDTPLTILHIS